MTQDTRKDRRVKIVSLNVRYKSATVDEFIENHALDVSRGGIYIKTGSPFPPGTLLKFEIRLASDQALITGVGRVVWKRDAGQGTGDRPAGMGVKFIKVDDPSKAVIDKLVNTRTDAGRSYEAESETPSPEAQTPVAASAARTPPPAPAGNRHIGKSTMLGMGAVSAASATGSRSSARPGTPSNAPRPSGGGMFPKTNSEAEMPPKQEQTVMKQAAELLEEALREAGGTMEDVGNNPLFAGTPAAAVSPVEVAPEAGPGPALPPAEAAPEGKAASLAPGEGPATAAEAARARAMVAGMAPASVIPQKAPSEPPRTTRDAPISKTAERKSLPSGRVSVRPAPGRASTSSAPPKPPKRGGSGVLILLGVAAAAGVVGVVYRDTLFGSTSPAVPASPPSVQAAATAPPLPMPSEAPSAVEAPAPSATDSAAAAASAAPSAAPSASASAGPRASASAGGPPAPVAAHTPHPVYAPKPVAPAPTATATATATAAAPDEAPAATATAAPTSTATSAPTSTSTASPTATPKPKGPKPADDNPY
jgi:uncharacterized protein (TIGR02266 family)